MGGFHCCLHHRYGLVGVGLRVSGVLLSFLTLFRSIGVIGVIGVIGMVGVIGIIGIKSEKSE